MDGWQGDSPTSSIDSSSHPALSTTSSPTQQGRTDLSTDLELGLSLSTSSLPDNSSNARNKLSDWPPIKPLLRSTLAAREIKQATFFVKVYMEGTPIGRKLDLLAHDGYVGLTKTLSRMFRTAILCPDRASVASEATHVLTYQDKEGDWMMAGDVPWEYDSFHLCVGFLDVDWERGMVYLLASFFFSPKPSSLFFTVFSLGDGNPNHCVGSQRRGRGVLYLKRAGQFATVLQTVAPQKLPGRLQNLFTGSTTFRLIIGGHPSATTNSP